MNISTARKSIEELAKHERSDRVVMLMELQVVQQAALYEQLSNLINLLSDGEDIEAPAKQKVKRIKSDPVPISKIVEIYNKCKNLSKINVISNTLKANIRARWKSDKKYQSLEFWSYMFQYVDNHNFLSGKTKTNENRKPFKANLEWIAKESNFTKIQNNYYDD